MNLEWYYTNNVNINDSVGIDEVGRGPLAGPVVSAAVWLSHDLAMIITNNENVMPVRDSKKMSHKQRQKVIDWIACQDKSSIQYAIGYASVEEIDELNILNAALLSMRRAYEMLATNKNIALVDGVIAPNLVSDAHKSDNMVIKTIVKGDATVLSIALASIIAKEYRDSIMHELSEEFPQYGWNTNVGYGSKAHLDAIYKYGITPHHRKSFAPIKHMLIRDHN